MAVKGLFADTGLDRLRLHGKKLDARVAETVESARLTRTIAGASTVSLTIGDPDYDLLRSKLFASRVGLNLDGLAFELAQVSKQQRQLSLTFEAGLVADLRRKRGPGPLARPGTTTRTNFAQRLVREVKYAKFQGDPDKAPVKVVLSRGGKQGGSKRENTWDALQRLASDRGWRCFEAEEVVYFGSDEWLLAQGRPFVISEAQEAVDWINFDFDTGKRAQTATVQCWVKRWAARPGVPVRINGLGDLTAGLWLVESIDRSLYSQQATVSLIRRAPELPEPVPEVEKDADYAEGGGSGTGATGTPGPTSGEGYQWPVGGPITSGYGPRGSGYHYGIDIGVGCGTPVKAAKPGVVTYAGGASGYGTLVTVRHNDGVYTRYGHMQVLRVRSGQEVGYDTIVGDVGQEGNSTGCHLHFEVRPGDSPTDPMGYLP